MKNVDNDDNNCDDKDNNKNDSNDDNDDSNYGSTINNNDDKTMIITILPNQKR